MRDVTKDIDPVALARELRGRGYTLEGIAATLNALGMRTVLGKRWSFVRVHQVLNNKV